MAEFSILDLVAAVGPGGAVVLLIASLLIKEFRNGKKEHPNTGVLQDIYAELKTLNINLESNSRRTEDIWDKINN